MTQTKEKTGSQKKIIVVGAGSIGQRHATNLEALGIQVSVFDINQALLKKICAEKKWDPVFDFDWALEQDPFDAAIICTPNHLHIPYAQKAVDARLNVFIEKPLSHNLNGVAELLGDLKKKDLISMAGFMLRYEPGLRYIKKILDPSAVAFALAEAGSHMPTWRLGTDYRKTYSANKSMGGGIILDDVHEIDYLCWFFGFPEKITCFAGRFSTFEIDVEDTADFHFQYPDKSVSLHSDYLQRRYSRICKIVFRDGYWLEWVFGEKVSIHNEQCEECFSYKDCFQINDMYMEEMKEFITCLDVHKNPESSLENAKNVLEIALIAKQGVRP